MKNAYFAGGCFWCITPSFAAMPGVTKVTAGYSGGTETNPVYLDVKYQKTGHRETIAVEYDPLVVNYSDLLEVFLCGVDLFDEGGQFIDRGHSYTLAVYYETEEEKVLVDRRLREIESMTGKMTYVAVEPFSVFYPAEEEHQDFYRRNPEAFQKELEESGRNTFVSPIERQ